MIIQYNAKCIIVMEVFKSYDINIFIHTFKQQVHSYKWTSGTIFQFSMFTGLLLITHALLVLFMFNFLSTELVSLCTLDIGLK